MSQQFTVQSESIRDKLNSLLPSQNLGAIGVELTASTQIIPIVDLTEVSEGSSLRQDLQLSFSHGSITSTVVAGATNTVLVNTTGYYRVFGNFYGTVGAVSANVDNINLFDGTTSKNIWAAQVGQGFNDGVQMSFDFIVFLAAGDSLRCTSNNVSQRFHIATRQIADLSGNLVNPI